MAETPNNSENMSRRKFLRNSGYVAGGLIGGGIIGGLLGANLNDDDNDKTAKTDTNAAHSSNQAPIYFTNPEQFAVLKAAVERIYPKDDNGPGAVDLGVPFFIDHQLAGSYGNNTREYMQGPFFPGSDFQGYQSPLMRHEAFDVGLSGLQSYSQQKYKKTFDQLEGGQQDEILKAFEEKKVKLKGITSSTFFNLLRSATLEGVFSDPVYAGNINMDGWKMKGFPGHQMSYLDKLDSKDFQKIKPNSLHA
jgi:gluconate 2-dehydrogenase gamma chain